MYDELERSREEGILVLSLHLSCRPAQKKTVFNINSVTVTVVLILYKLLYC
jgi:hypothetical protein